MRVGIVSSAVMAGVLLASFGLTACSSGSATSAASGAEVSAEAVASADADVPADVVESGPDTSGDPVTAAAACAEINTMSAGALKGMTSENADDWQLFSDDLLTLSDGAEDPAVGGALMSLAVAAAFTVNGLQSEEPLATAKGDFDTAWTEINTICTAAGTPLK